MSRYHFECKPEECLLFNLGIGKEHIEHHPGRGQVCKMLEENRNLIGLVDEDPDADHHPYFKRLNNDVESDEHGIRFCIDRAKNNRLIILKPKFEDWIIQSAELSNISLTDFSLSHDANKLHREINFNIGKLQSLIHALKKARNPAIIRLKRLVNS